MDKTNTELGVLMAWLGLWDHGESRTTHPPLKPTRRCRPQTRARPRYQMTARKSATSLLRRPRNVPRRRYVTCWTSKTRASIRERRLSRSPRRTCPTSTASPVTSSARRARAGWADGALTCSISSSAIRINPSGFGRIAVYPLRSPERCSARTHSLCGTRWSGTPSRVRCSICGGGAGRWRWRERGICPCRRA